MPAPADAEARLLAAAQAGDAAAYAALVEDHLPALAAFVRRAAPWPDAAEDIVQETLLRAWRHLAGFRGESSFRTWLFAIAWRAARSAGARRDRAQLLADPPELADPAVGPEELALQRVQAGQAKRLLESLRPPWREAIRRVDVDGQPLAAAAREMGIPLGTLKTHLHRGRRQLARLLDRDTGGRHGS